MRRKLGSIVSAGITLLVFIVLPFYAPRLIPPEFGELLDQVGFDLAPFLNQVTIIGFVLAFLTLIKGFVSKASLVYLSASIALSALTFSLTLFSLSMGDWRRLSDLESLGITSISMEFRGGLNTTVMDLRLFIQLAALSVALKAVHSILEFMDARTEEAQTELDEQSKKTELS